MLSPGLDSAFASSVHKGVLIVFVERLLVESQKDPSLGHSPCNAGLRHRCLVATSVAREFWRRVGRDSRQSPRQAPLAPPVFGRFLCGKKFRFNFDGQLFSSRLFETEQSSYCCLSCLSALPVFVTGRTTMQEHVVDESKGPYFPMDRREQYPKRMRVNFRRLAVCLVSRVRVCLVHGGGAIKIPFNL